MNWICYEELFREMKKCKNNKEIHELLDKVIESCYEQDIEFNPLRDELLDVMEEEFKNKVR